MGEGREEAQMIVPAVFPHHQYGHLVHQSKGGDLAHVSGTIFPSSLPALLL